MEKIKYEVLSHFDLLQFWKLNRKTIKFRFIHNGVLYGDFFMKLYHMTAEKSYVNVTTD